ncbi:dehydrogenase [Sulfolobus sp. S-194]|uniref:molybdopterin-dependent oxidoreductase n=1 Tax=Sulfolobus sp. S-194 TaxID=2512240 RepID=UPI0014371F08|nr:molybdopterin-dependent oxidoreductase [Sulfolobus sp. S-194]QIW23505.1 dehydrogenase [Sulfolobus sp. S-194]
MMIACTRDCYDTCIFDSNYKPLNIFPVNGFTCSRGITDLKRNEINRVDSAYIEGKPVSIDEAVKYVVKKIKEVRKEEILHVDYDGNQGLLTWYYPARLWNVIGAASTDYSICSAEGHEAIKIHYGTSFGALPEDFAKYNAVVFWGSEAVFSFIHGWRILSNKYKITIDVRMSETAKRSEKVYIINPSSDAFLAIGIIKTLFYEGLYDSSLIDDIETLKNYVNSYDFSSIEEVTGLSQEEIEELAELYYYYKPLTIIGFALGRTYNGGDAISLISLIPALLGIKRGFFYSNSQGGGIDFSYLRGLHIAKPSRIIGMAEVGKEVEKGNVKFLFNWNSNPIHSLPGSDKIKEALEEGKLFLVSHDPFWNETTKIANVVIPAPTFLEKYDVVYSYWHNYIVYNEPIRSQKGITEVELMKKFAKEYGIISHPLIGENEWSAVNNAIRGTGVSLQELKDKKIVKINKTIEVNKVKVEPLPKLTLPPKGIYLVFSSHPNHTNSQFKEIYSQMPIAYNSQFDGIGYLENSNGKVKVLLKKDESIPNNVVFMFKSSLIGLDNNPVNSLIGSEKGRYGGTPLLNGYTVNIRLIK